jgi:hypothetical protein
MPDVQRKRLKSRIVLVVLSVLGSEHVYARID